MQLRHGCVCGRQECCSASIAEGQLPELHASLAFMIIDLSHRFGINVGRTVDGLPRFFISKSYIIF